MLKLLIVDDELWTRESVKALGDWQGLGIEIVGEARDGQEGIRLIEELKPDIVLTDMNMPGVDGVGLLKVLHQDHPEVKVVVISGFDDFNYAKHALRANAVDYILKPVDPKELNETLAKCIAQLADRETSSFDLTRKLDNGLIERVLEEKKVVRRLLADCNAQGVKNLMLRLRQLTEPEDVDGKAAGGYLEKVFSEVAMEQLLVVKSKSPMSPELERALSVSRPVPESLIDALDWVEKLLLDAIRHMIQCKNEQEGGVITQVKEYVERNYTEKITLEGIAKAFYISKEYLSKAYKQKYGMNLMNQITELRMKKAKTLIQDPEISIKSIAETVGYEDLSHFYHVFKNHYGISPGEMRKEMSNTKG